MKQEMIWHQLNHTTASKFHYSVGLLWNIARFP